MILRKCLLVAPLTTQLKSRTWSGVSNLCNSQLSLGLAMRAQLSGRVRWFSWSYNHVSASSPATYRLSMSQNIYFCSGSRRAGCFGFNLQSKLSGNVFKVGYKVLGFNWSQKNLKIKHLPLSTNFEFFQTILLDLTVIGLNYFFSGLVKYGIAFMGFERWCHRELPWEGIMRKPGERSHSVGQKAIEL